MVLPTANIVRTTDKRGDIKVTVNSPGLESAGVILHSTPAVEPEDGIVQPEFSDAGRVMAMRDTSVVSTTPEVLPRVFELIGHDYNLPATCARAPRRSFE